MTEAEQNRLITENMAIVYKVAADYRGSDIEYEDLIAVGRVGLVQAARTFDCTKGKFSDHASARVNGEIKMALRSGNYAIGLGEDDEEGEVKFWDHWGNLGNARAIFELWPEPEQFDGCPEGLAIHYDEIKDKKAKFEAAFISLTPMERKAIQLVYLRDPKMTITQAAREMRISYLRTWRALERGLKKMTKVIQSMEANQFEVA